MWKRIVVWLFQPVKGKSGVQKGGVLSNFPLQFFIDAFETYFRFRCKGPNSLPTFINDY